LQEQLGSFAIARLRQVEVYGLAMDGTEQILLFTGDANESLIHMPSRRFPLHFPLKPVQYFRTVTLGPAPDGGMVDGQASLRHQLFNLSQAQAESAVPSDARNDDVRLELSLPEQRWAAGRHGITLSNAQMQHFPCPSWPTVGNPRRASMPTLAPSGTHGSHGVKNRRHSIGFC